MLVFVVFLLMLLKCLIVGAALVFVLHVLVGVVYLIDLEFFAGRGK
jgi:hypothetical protein